MKKLRVWHIPQVPGKQFYVYVDTIEEGKKVMDILAAYDLFQLENRIKPDFTNVQVLQMYEESENDWIDWDIETEDDYFDDVNDYLADNEELNESSETLFSQLKLDKRRNF